ncbi:MAG: FkbM family methyltransferase, partial [Acidimicrobiia bacterium]
PARVRAWRWELHSAAQHGELRWRLVHSLPELRLTRQTRHGRLSFSNKDAVIGRHLYLYRHFEYDKILAALQTLRESGVRRAGGLLIDVGANVGTVCIPLVRSGAFSGALAFEPEPKNHQFLLRNIRQNGLTSSITAFDCALSSQSGTMELSLSPSNFGDHRLGGDQPHGHAMLSVSVRRLDDVLTEAGLPWMQVGLLWMDVQGHEIHVLAGAERLIMSGVPVVAEFWPYGLHAAGIGQDQYCNRIASMFEGFHDLADQPSKRRDPIEVRGLFDRYQGEHSFTDLLLLPKRRT